jgi:hypothetical protein
MPFKGKMTRVGLPGLYEIVAEIERQYAEHQDQDNRETRGSTPRLSLSGLRSGWPRWPRGRACTNE